MCAESAFNYTSSLKTASWKQGTDCFILKAPSIPTAPLFSLHHVRRLYLGGNHLTGTIPSSICRKSSLRVLHLMDNYLSGTILPCLGNLSNLVVLKLGLNQLEGSLPRTLANCTNLMYLNVHENMFDGFLPIPPVTAEAYAASGNKFSGEIPSSFCNVTTLVLIDMSDNSLTGKIPQCLIIVNTNLAMLFLAKNRLRGPIPEILARKNCSLNTVILSQNHLQGKLPRSWASCKQLEVLDLCDNELEDSFLSWLETLPNLHILVLRANKFHGPITSPKFIHPFPVLHILDISNNNFIGTFPSQYIANFNYMMGGDKGQGLLKYSTETWSESHYTTVIYKGVQMQLSPIREALVVIDLSHNHFQGEVPKEPSSPVNLTRQRMVDVSGLCIKCEEQNNTAVRLFMFRPEGHAC
ncbi:receptor-like protein 43 [Punica granatum]|uniref:Receptor-like protein 43 n=1 Tax=Punica granatum TaxID=22663 RepID=A0A6P8C4N3_PUNGR|nr:receptor-like protein 43 [Punica granatum]